MFKIEVVVTSLEDRGNSKHSDKVNRFVASVEDTCALDIEHKLVQGMQGSIGNGAVYPHLVTIISYSKIDA